MKKLVSLILALCMLLTLTGAFAEAQPVYVALGDSITAGYGLGEGEKAFPQLVAEQGGYALVNHGVNGNTATGILAQLDDPAVLADIARADVITITCGGNDLLAMLYQSVAMVFNATVPAVLVIQPGDVLAILANPEDSRHQALQAAAYMVLAGNEEMGVVPFVQSDAMKAALAAYLQNMTAVMTAIRTANPDVQIVIATQYSPYEHFTGDYAALAAGMGAGAQALSQCIGEYAAALGCDVADVYTAFAAVEENLCNATMEPLNLDFHPNAAGHAVIATCMLAALTPAAE